jgi:hypothetical protein
VGDIHITHSGRTRPVLFPVGDGVGGVSSDATLRRKHTRGRQPPAHSDPNPKQNRSVRERLKVTRTMPNIDVIVSMLVQ